jgi:DNA polymerase-1
MKNKRFFIIDGNSFCYRAYYAIRSLSNSKGRPTNAVYGFITMLNKLVKEENPDYLAVAFDLKGPTFRHKKFADYKITRKPMPDDLADQLPVIKELLGAYKVAILEKKGFEADDIIATLTKKAREKKIDTYIVTGDKDAMQLIGEKVRIYYAHKDGMIVGAKEVKERFGVTPERIVDLLALMGDNSDSIPGVPGIGEKTAVSLIKEFGSLDNLIKNSSRIKSDSQRRKIAENVDLALMSRDLAVLEDNVDIEVDFGVLKPGPPNNKKLLTLFKELEFRKLLKDIIPGDTVKTEFTVAGNERQLTDLAEKLKKQKAFAFDFETTGSDPMSAEPVGVSFCFGEEAVYVPIGTERHKEGRIGRRIVFDILKPIFEEESIKKSGQNIKYEMVILLNNGIELKGVYFDTMVASYLLNPSKPNHNLQDICFEYLNHKMTPITDLIGKGKDQITMDDVDIGNISRYCCEDSDVTWRLSDILNRQLKEKGLYKLFHDIEIPLIEVLARMEKNGVCVDCGVLSKMSGDLESGMEKLTKDIFETAGGEFNINSPKQLSAVLFEDLKLPVIRRTKTGYSTDEQVLKKLCELHDLPKKLLRYRELSKLKSTYVDALPKLINPQTQRVHTSFNQTVTQTGRLSSSDPNLQNIPVRTEMGRSIRKAFTSCANSYILSADYSQVELRILAHLCGDKNLLKAFKEDRDIHDHTASLIFQDIENKSKDLSAKTRYADRRAVAKTVNFGIIYGMSSYGLSKDLDIGIEQAQEFIDSYFSRYPDVKRFIDDQIGRARKDGFVATIFGRRRYIPEINSQNLRVRQFAERTAINAPVQGSAADLIKKAMIDIHNEFCRRSLSTRMLLQVHDELVFESSEDELKTVCSVVKEKMEGAINLKVPVKVNLKRGPNWLEMEPVDGAAKERKA